MTKSTKLVWLQQFQNAHSMPRVREGLNQKSNAFAAFQQDVSLFLLLDIVQHSMNVVSFSTYLIVQSLNFENSLDCVLIFSATFIRTVILTFACGLPVLEVVTKITIYEYRRGVYTRYLSNNSYCPIILCIKINLS